MADIETLEMECAKLGEEISATDRSLTELNEKRRQLQRRLDLASAELERVRPDTSLIDSIKTFTATQHQQRAARVELAEKALGLGITAEILTGKSTLDQAMGRKNRRGVTRPQRAA